MTQLQFKLGVVILENPISDCTENLKYAIFVAKMSYLSHDFDLKIMSSK